MGTAGEGWSPPTGVIDYGDVDASPSQVFFSAAEAGPAPRTVLLAWALQADIEANNCSLPVKPPVASADNVFLVEMNHLEVYRGSERWRYFALPLGFSRFYFRVASVSPSVSKPKVLAVRDAYPPVDVYYNQSSAGACTRANRLLLQPDSSLAGYV